MWAFTATADTFKKTVGICEYVHGFILPAYVKVFATFTEENTFSFVSINSRSIRANRNKGEEC